MTPEQERKLDEVHDEVKSISVALKGYNGYMGALEQIKTHAEGISNLKACVEPLPEMAKEVDELKKDVRELKQAPSRNAMKAWKWVAGVVATAIVAAGSALITTKVEALSKPVATSSASINPAGKVP